MEENNPVPLISLSWLHEVGKLSARVVNICTTNRITDTRMLLKFYQENGNFLMFRNMGVKANKEIADFCTALAHQPDILSTETEDSPPLPAKYFLIYKAYTSLSAREKQAFDFLAGELIAELPVRARNTLTSQSFGNPTVAGIIQQFADKEFDFLRLRNVGVHTLGQLEHFTLQLNRLFASAKSEEYSRHIIRDGIKGGIATKIKGCSALFKEFLLRCSEAETGTPFPVWKFLENCFFQTEIMKPNVKRALLASGNFFENRTETLAFNEAQTHSLYKERARQITLREHLNAVFLKSAYMGLTDLTSIGIGNNFSYFAEIEDDLFLPHAPTLNAQNGTHFTTAFFCYAISTFSGRYFVCYSKLRRVYFLLHKDLHTTLNFKSLMHNTEHLLKTRTLEKISLHLEGLMQRFSYAGTGRLAVPPQVWERTQNGVVKMLKEIYGIRLHPEETHPATSGSSPEKPVL